MTRALTRPELENLKTRLTLNSQICDSHSNLRVAILLVEKKMFKRKKRKDCQNAELVGGRRKGGGIARGRPLIY